MASRVVKRAFKYRCYPSDTQAQQLVRTFGSVRYVYNRALAERSRAWTQEQRRVTHAETDRMLTGWKRDPDTVWLAEPSKGPLQATLRNLQTAYVNFWQKRTKYPTFKKRGKTTDSATYFRSCFTYRDGRVTLAKQDEPLSIVWSRPLPDGAAPSQVTVSRNSRNQYFVSILCEATVSDGPATDSAVGLDAGITSLLTLSTGEKIVNPKHERADRARLRRAQQNLARKAKGSANRDKARLRVAKVHGRINDRRRDHLHKLSSRIIRQNQTVIIEDLNVRNMVRNHSLARAISDASWRELRRQLEYKAAWYGRTVVAIDRFYPSSKTCLACGRITGSMPLSVREWTCRCGVAHDRDVNAAKVIRGAGLALLASGDGVRPART